MPVNQVCRVLGVSRSGYYTARKRAQAQPVVCEASVHLRAAFAASRAVLQPGLLIIMSPAHHFSTWLRYCDTAPLIPLDQASQSDQELSSNPYFGSTRLPLPMPLDGIVLRSGLVKYKNGIDHKRSVPSKEA